MRQPLITGANNPSGMQYIQMHTVPIIATKGIAWVILRISGANRYKDQFDFEISGKTSWGQYIKQYLLKNKPEGQNSSSSPTFNLLFKFSYTVSLVLPHL